MTFLKKLGTVVLKVIGIATGLLPLVQTAIAPSSPNIAADLGLASDKLGAAFNAIVTAEQMFSAATGPDAKTGSQKLAAASPYVAALVQSIPLLSGKKPKDEAKFEAAVTQITSSLADVLNSYGD